MILDPILISLKIASIATVSTFLLGTFLAYVFKRFEFKGKDFLEVLVTLPMVLPPSVTGYGLLILIGKRGLLGGFLLDKFGVSLVFTWVAGCIAASVVSLPLMYQSAKSALMGVDQSYENAARTLGAGEWKVFRKVTLPLAWPGIISGIVLSFARALGEFGATLMVAGNIPGKTETIPLSIYYAVESGNTSKANTLMAIVVAFSFVLIFSLNRWLKKKKYSRRD
ncbi:molybdenum transport system permease protein ModB [Andreesenia angusta]|uniref:Molybdenum transport system permease n=1 Tax=Andreesenia angusta TaxID=39480 RepID=A0A1S1VA85_9FIRM|nr:molybdate ABC transporter permease subunit [Andreesenia angusta]OHW63526.1 molybdenum transport system permease protein ModB [Andreesenia angusta]